jgi:tetratricopeptide (TPR) repeat protein
MNCDLRADLAGFRSQLVSLANRHAMDSPDLGIIYLHRQAPGEGNLVSANSLAAPKDARKAFEKGQALLKKNKADDAVKEFQKAVLLYPAFSAAWCELGKIEVAHDQRDIARGSFNEAIKADPKYVEPYLQLSQLASAARNWQELAEVSGKVLQLDSFDYPEQFFLNAAAHYNLHNFDEAEKSLRSAEKLDTRHQFPEILYLKGLVLARRRDYPAAAEQLRTYLKLTPDSPNAATARTQLAQIEKVLAQSAAATPDGREKQ